MKKLLFTPILITAMAFGQATTIGVNGTLTLNGSLDASSATASKPMKQGTSLPATCNVGEQYFKTDATAGQNLYGCTASNTWTQQAGGGGSTYAAALTDFQVVRTSSTILTMGAATSSAPASYAMGGKINSLATIPTITLVSGSGTVYLYGTTAGSIIAGYNGFSISCATGCTATSGITAFPDDVFRIATWTASAGSWASTGTDYRAPYNRGPQIAAGTGISLTKDETNGTVTVAASGSSTDSPQLICVNSNIASANAGNTYTALATCTIPANTLATGDLVRITVRYLHAGGTAIAPRFELQWGSTTSTEVAGAVTSLGWYGEFIINVLGSSSQRGSGRFTQDVNGTPLVVAGLSSLTEAVSGTITINVLGRMTTAGAESIAVDGYAVEVLKAH